jgi:large subunit ribosomal protein L5e
MICRYNSRKLTHEERRSRLVERLNALNSSGGDGNDQDEDN